MSIFAKKILFNITQHDHDRMTEMCRKKKLSQSEFIRRAVRVYIAEFIIAELDRGEFGSVGDGSG